MNDHNRADTQLVVDQNEMGDLWPNQWKKEDATPGKFFSHRVFLESYPVFKSYLPVDKTGLKLLEVGAGSGRHGLKFAMDFSNLRVILTDVSVENLSRWIAQLKLKNAVAEVADATKLPYSDESFDIVFCDAVIQYISDYEKAVSEMIRVLKPGGRFILSTINWWNLPHLIDKKISGKSYLWGKEKSFTHGELRKLVKEGGLSIVAEDGFAAAHGIFRLKHRHRLFGHLGRALNRTLRVIDPLLGRSVNRYFGFQIVIVADKQK